ncbi:hypothetical protein MSAN_02293600 [Mycena sanguinolenta]|uniref:Uncharacterized protein n=1 Tax=Mycena sanguinolenta TaxID=230812 RepID=A0A8H6X9D3_9AGAR|nr:hypothetical protein MSAN_02293600 [Mycena sanguinolenta]
MTQVSADAVCVRGIHKLPWDVFEEIALLVQGASPHSLWLFRQLDRKIRRWVESLLWRIVVVAEARPSGFCESFFEMRSMGFCVTSARRFLSEKERAVTSRHLRIDARAETFGRVFDACPSLTTLWIDGGAGRPKLKTLDRLRWLRELTIPFECATDQLALQSTVLSTVTHLFLVPVGYAQTIHPEMFRCFPSLLRLGFAAEPGQGSLELALRMNGALGVLVHGPPETLHRGRSAAGVPAPEQGGCIRNRMAEAGDAAALDAVDLQRGLVGPLDDLRRHCRRPHGRKARRGENAQQQGAGESQAVRADLKNGTVVPTEIPHAQRRVDVSESGNVAYHAFQFRSQNPGTEKDSAEFGSG